MTLALEIALQLALAATLFALVAFAARWLTPWAARERSPWGVTEALLAFFISLLAGVLLVGMVGLLREHPEGEPAAMPIGMKCLLHFASHLVTVVAILLLARSCGPGNTLAALGLRRGGNLRAMLLGALACLALYPLVLALFGIQEQIWTWWFAGKPPVQGILQEAREIPPGLERWLVFAFIGLAIPVFEELLFRGFIQPALSRALGRSRGLILTAIVFALVHDTAVWLPIFGFALITGWLYQRTGRLSAPIVLHAIVNSVTLLWSTPAS